MPVIEPARRRWRILAESGRYLLIAPGCEVARYTIPWPRRKAWHRWHREGYDCMSCGRSVDSLSEAIQFVEVELILEKANSRHEGAD